MKEDFHLRPKAHFFGLILSQIMCSSVVGFRYVLMLAKHVLSRVKHW